MSPQVDAVKVLRQVFLPQRASRISLVRIAAHISEVGKCGPLVKTLTQLGYRVCINIMQSNNCSVEELSALIRSISEFESIEVIYFADSLGNMDELDTKRIATVIREHWKGALGFHGHDNLGKGLANTLHGILNGVTWVDATVAGMGRGAGNTHMEYLLGELNSRELKNVNAAPMIELAVLKFGPLKNQYGWGSNIFYHIGALHEVHPTYIQELLVEEDDFAPNDIVLLIELLGKNKGNSYRPQGIAQLMSERFDRDYGVCSYSNIFTDRLVIVVACGPSAKRHWPAIETYIRSNNAIVITLNMIDFVPREIVNIVATCHPGRMISFMGKEQGMTLMVPVHSIPVKFKDMLAHSTLMDYGMKVAEGTISIKSSGCTLPLPLVAPYAICAALGGHASKIALAGLDGFEGHGRRYREMNGILSLLMNVAGDTPIISLTPTHYDVPEASVYL